MLNRRQFLQVSGLAFAATQVPALRAESLGASPFHIGVITDEISMDFDHACSVAANDFGMHFVELRSLWGKNLQSVDDTQLAEAERILAKYKLTVTDIASPLYKVNWPGAPRSSYGGKEDMHNAADYSFRQQAEVAERCVAQAKRFKTNKVRCFDFWRLNDIAPYREAINAKLQETAEQMAKSGVQCVLENEFECNTATGAEAAKTLAGVPSSNFFLNWDPANAVMRGELDAFPKGWDLLPKQRIHHCHVKNAIKGPNGKIVWAPVGTGYIDWAAQFAALKRVGYHDAVSLETHWKSTSPEAASRESWQGMKQALIKAGALA